MLYTVWVFWKIHDVLYLLLQYHTRSFTGLNICAPSIYPSFLNTPWQQYPLSGPTTVYLSTHLLEDILVAFKFHCCCCSVAKFVWLFVTPWTAARQAFLSFTISKSLLKFMSIESVMPSNYRILVVLFSSCPQLSRHQGLFQWVSSSHQVAKVLDLHLQHQSFQWIQDWFPLGLTGLISLQSRYLY